ncbi:FkbM family methyltransferase [Thermostichus vulcanus]|uniref:FkbM family methyltransferase n=1 Tax=Thermostichus vulcanus str. 'Rupite' TaxID=2813851 RepID=A0ABT0C828_THEVL|nr:FkbM family methyltransferase [Thermostichus vulcanus]MCJ2541948.1 FkbM family methyltransferase [Thermostichus vulcanus str. 'Rupite']
MCTTPDEYNELGLSHHLRALQAQTSRERRAAWALALASWRQGLDLDPTHLPCQLNRLHALLALGSFHTVIQEGKDLLSKLLTERYLEDPTLGLSGLETKLVWDPTKLADTTASHSAGGKPSGRIKKTVAKSQLDLRERYLHALARWLAHHSGVAYRPEALPYWRLAAAIDPEDLEAQMVVAMNAVAQAQPEGPFLLQRIASRYPNQRERAIQALKLALNHYVQQEQSPIVEPDSEAEATPQEEGKGSSSKEKLEIWIQYEGYKFNLEPNLRSIVTFVLLTQDRWFESEIELCRQILKPGMNAIDVGANVGVYTFLFARCVGKSGKVYAIEPTPGCLECLRATTTQNKLDKSVQVIEAAVGEEPGEVYLVEEGASVFNRIVTDPMSVVEETKPVQQITLDELWISEGNPTIDLLKVDAEGAEVPVLKGGRKMIEACTPVIMFENQHAGQTTGLESARVLAEFGYLIYVYNPLLKDLSPIQASVQPPSTLNLTAVHPNRFPLLSEAGLI